MPQTINVPGVGQLQFPDGMSQADMASAIQRNFPQIHAESSSNGIPGGGVSGSRNLGKVDEPTSFMDKVTGGIEAARNVATGMTTGALGYVGGALGGIAGSIANGDFGTERGTRMAKDAAEEGAASLTYQPKTELGQQYSQNVAHAIDSSGIVGVPIPELEALGRALPITRRVAGPSMDRAVPAVDYDIPAYQRNGIKPVPEIAGPAPELVGPVQGTDTRIRTPAQAAPEAQAPTLPPSSAPAPTPTALDTYAASAAPSPYGALNEPVIPAATPSTGIDAYAAHPEPAARPVAPNQFDDMLRESAPATPDKSPLDSLIAGESAPAKAITAGLRDTSDIDSILQNFGVDVPKTVPAAPQPIRGPVMPTESVERATAPIQALDSTLRVPEPIPGPRMPVAAPMETVERAVVPAAPIDDAVRVPEVPAERPFVPTPEQHVDPALSERNTQVLRDVGLDKIRYSAVEGKSAEAAREFQHGKFDEPAGHMWDAQFKAETEAMQNYTKQLVDDTKGKTGLDSESLGEKGRDIAAPYDAIRKYFEDGKENLYKIADERAAATGKSVVTQSLDALLADPDFVATLMAKDQQGLLNTIKSQAERFKSLDENGLSVVNAEKFRKWLNKVWSPDKSGTLGEVKAALDADVFRTAGQDVYAQARQMHQLEKAVLDDPTGISKLFDADPRTPINRSTPYEKIPNEIVKLSDDHFKHVINTYKQLAAEAPELAPVVQQAIDTLKAHYAERILHAGTESVKGNPRGLWDTGSVKTFTDRNSAKLPMIFDANEMQRINTMLQAGEILRVNPAYPGAAAQAANASKAGLMTRMVGKLGVGVGGGAGALIMGPAGAAVGGIAGEAGLSKLAKFAGERKALAEAKARIINEHRTPPTPPSPIDEWEAGHR